MQAAILPERGIVRVTGPEAREFLQGLVSNDMAQVAPDRALYAALLSPQGKILFDFLIVEHDGAFLLDCERARAADLAKRLGLYKLRAKVTVDDVSAQWRIAALWGPDSANLSPMTVQIAPALGGLAFADPRLPELGVRLLIADPAWDWPAGHDFTVATPEAYHRACLALGVGQGSADLGIEVLFLLEANAEPLHGVDFRKGCYVGQELTSRMKHRAAVRKRLMPARIDGAFPDLGAPVLAGGKEVGTVRAGTGDRALVLVRLESWRAAREAGLPLTAGETGVTIEPPAWLAPFVDGRDARAVPAT